MAQYNVGIVGCGLMGGRRAAALEKFSHSKLVKVCDTNIEKAKQLAEKYSCGFTADSKEVTADSGINLVIVATVSSSLAPIAVAALNSKKHVLVEKPCAVNPAELKKVIEAHKQSGQKLKAGFNHRFHPAIIKAKEIIRNENIGDVMFIRGRYGHGGRPGYEKEWRASRQQAGGGELLDQGSHLIDLARYFMGDVADAAGFTNTFFWSMEVEDNCFLLLRSGKNQVAQLHASWTEWKNRFTFDIMCKTGQISIDGLGRSYGRESLTFYKMKPGMGVPDKFEYSWDEDDSFEKEYADFIGSIESDREPNGSIHDAHEAMLIVSKVYEGGKNGNIFGHR
ncbi:Gfo/Idh/MocA family oxidoreductase [Candidatus Woesearchaeota archaeon]|nr:Gfo/Idh/MocA family oxidoreductase [Candidatus Woesearchaeota archaeon]